MNRFFLLLSLLLFPASLLPAQDVLFMKNGDKRSGHLTGLDDLLFRFQVPLPPPPGAAPGGAPVFASVSIPRGDVIRIEFAPDPALDALLKSAEVGQLPELETCWDKFQPWLAVPRSPSARIANVLGDLLLLTGDPARALDLFKKVESGAWNDADKLAARQGRLRAMVATGNAGDAVNEAMALSAVTENPAVLLEAKYLLASSADASLRKLLADNPRWEEDANILPERNRLYNEALDLYLFPCLFAGSESEAAARGLWGAAGIYILAGENQKALECARDITTLYPHSKFAASAAGLIASLPEAKRTTDSGKDDGSKEIPTQKKTDKPAKPNEEPTKKKSHGNKKTKSA